MKILMQNSVFFPNVIGGAEMSSHLLALKIQERGHQADALATTGTRQGSSDLITRPLGDSSGTVYESSSNGFYDIFSPDGPVIQPGIVVRGMHHFAAIYSPRWEKLAGQAMDLSQPDVLHTNTLVGMTPAVWKAAQKRKIPIVHTLRDYHLLCPRTTLMRSDNTDCTSSPLPCTILRRLKLTKTSGIEVVTAPSSFVLKTHTDAGGFPDAKPVRVPNACENILPAIPQGRDALPARGIFLGQLDEHKGVGLILKALDELLQEDLPEFGFDFAGVGPMSPQVEEFCARDPHRFKYHGLVQGETKYDLLKKASFLLVPSVWNDNFPRTMLDAFSYGMPVIGSHRGGIPEVVGHEVEGLIISPEAAPLAQAIKTYLQNPALRLKHGEAAFQSAKKYTLDKQVDGFMEIYESLVG